MPTLVDRQRITFGSLRYEFLAHDAWGAGQMARLRGNLICERFEGPPDRTLHLCEYSPTPAEHDEINADHLPGCVLTPLPGGPPRSGWKLTGDGCGRLTWLHRATADAACTFCEVWQDDQAPWHLPWPTSLRAVAG